VKSEKSKNGEAWLKEKSFALTVLLCTAFQKCDSPRGRVNYWGAIFMSSFWERSIAKNKMESAYTVLITVSWIKGVKTCL